MPQTDNKNETSRPNLGRSTMTEGKDQVFESYEMVTFYSMLGVSEKATAEELKVAYRNLALQQHPDKGGDADKFHELQMAYDVLEAQDKRDAYDEELRRARDRSQLVEGAEQHTKKANTTARVKTAPTEGSKRSKKVDGQGGCKEWKDHGCGTGVLKALTDGATVEQKADLLFSRYKELPRNMDKKRQWLKGIHGEEKVHLKAAAKEHEAAQTAKLNKWLGNVAKPVPKQKAQGYQTAKMKEALSCGEEAREEATAIGEVGQVGQVA